MVANADADADADAVKFGSSRRGRPDAAPRARLLRANTTPATPNPTTTTPTDTPAATAAVVDDPAEPAPVGAGAVSWNAGNAVGEYVAAGNTAGALRMYTSTVTPLDWDHPTQSQNDATNANPIELTLDTDTVVNGIVCVGAVDTPTPVPTTRARSPSNDTLGAEENTLNAFESCARDE